MRGKKAEPEGMVGGQLRGTRKHAYQSVFVEGVNVKGSREKEGTKEKEVRGDVEKKVAFLQRQVRLFSEGEGCIGLNNTWIKGV